MTDCQSVQEQIERFIAGDLKGEQAQAIREHLSACTECNELVRLETALLRTAAVSAPGTVPAGFAERVVERWGRELQPVDALVLSPAGGLEEIVRALGAAFVQEMRLANYTMRQALRQAFVAAWSVTIRALIRTADRARFALAHGFATTTCAVKLAYEVATS